MRALLIVFVMALFFNGCAISGIVSEQAILFNSTAPVANISESIFKPYDTINFTVEFICPGKCRSAMISPVIPLPPVVPLGFMGQRELYIKLVFPRDEEIPIKSMHIALNKGDLVQLYEATEFYQSNSEINGFCKILRLHIDCSELQGGEFRIEGFTYQGEMYPPKMMKLEFKSRQKIIWNYWGS